MKYTLLELVQSIMSDMVSDDITSITDTPESLSVASIIKDTYYQLISNQVIPEHQALVQLTSASTAKVFMKLPDTVIKLGWIKYNKIKAGDTDTAFGTIIWKSPSDFMQLLLQRKSSDTNVVSATDPTSSIALDMFVNNAAPTYWTTFDDEYICFDSYDVAVDASGLVASKTLCWATLAPEDWDIDDAFVPDIDDNVFPLLLAEAKSACFVALKQQANPKVDKQARNQKVALQNDKFRTADSQKASTGATGPNYGRRGYSSSRNGLSGPWKYGP